MSTERIGNIGYFAVTKQSDATTVATPDDFIPLYEETMKTNGNLQRQAPVYGSKFGTMAVLQGQRDHVRPKPAAAR